MAANRQPDFRTICRFRAEREEAFEELFVEVLRLCHEAGLVKLGVVALDGTKVAANAALRTPAESWNGWQLSRKLYGAKKGLGIV